MTNIPSRFWSHRGIIIYWLLYSVLTLALNSIFLLSQYWVFHPTGSSDLFAAAMLLEIPLFVGIIIFAVSLIALFFRSKRRHAQKYLIASTIYIVIAVAFITCGAQFRRNMFHTLASDGERIVKAIRLFEKAHGKPPETLEDLVPEYFTEIPMTGIGCCPRYGYIVSSAQSHTENKEALAGVRWAIYLSIPSFQTDWRCLLFVSDTRYDNIHDVTVFTRIKDWAILSGVPKEI